jgi:hypothetical protein
MKHLHVILSLALVLAVSGCIQSGPVIIGEYDTAQAEKQMMNEFAKGDSTALSTLPERSSFTPGKEVRFKVGIKKVNDAYDYFKICIGVRQGSSSSCSIPNSPDIPIRPNSKGKGYSGIEFLYQPNYKITEVGDIARARILMTIPASATKETHEWTIFVCPVDGPDGNCIGNWKGTGKHYGEIDMIVTVE